MDKGETCSTREAAAMLGISVRGAQLWVEQGKLEAWKTPGGHRRIFRRSVMEILRRRQPDSRILSEQFNVLVVEDDAGCPKNPSWQIRAVRVVYDQAKNKIRYKGARVEVFGLPLIPLPGLSHPANNDAGSGILVPDVRLGRTNGFEIALP